MSETYVVGVDLGGTLVRAVLADERGTLLERREVRTLAHEGLDAVLGRIVEVVRSVSQGAPYIASVGIGAPGPIDSRAGVVSRPPNLQGWEDVSLGSLVQGRTGLPARLGNDANLAALGEYTYGSGRDVRHLVYITVSTGVGAGIIADGVLLEGQRGAAGEVGHTIVEPGGVRCSCGGRGHLEAYVSGTAIGRQARDAVAKGERSLVMELAGEDATAIGAHLVTEAAERGDELSLRLLATAGRRLGVAVQNLVHTLNPQMVSIGGGVSSAGELLMGPMREAVYDGLLSPFERDLQLVTASLGGDAGLYGAVALALREAGELAAD